MKLKTAVYYAAMFLQLGEVCEALEGEGDYPAAAAGEIDRLTRCLNLVLNEAACDYLPLKTVEEVVSADGEIRLEALSKPVVDIYAVRSEAGLPAPYKSYFDRITLSAPGRYRIEYSYAPGTLDIDDDSPYSERVPARALAYGTACEYCIISGMTDEAVLWDKRFKDALGIAALKKGEKRVPKRRWL